MPFYGHKNTTFLGFLKNHATFVFPHPSKHKIKENRFRRKKVFLCVSGSLTVECALILPLFLMVMLCLVSVINLVSSQAEGNLELSNKARRLAVYAGVADNQETSSWIDLSDSKELEIPFLVLPLKTIRAACRARVYPWTGNSGELNSFLDSAGQESMVYLTDNAEVYHTHADCTHLQLSILAVSMDQISHLRNESGSKYKKCPGFPAGYQGTVYITTQGEYYYPSTNYGSLTRHVRLVKESEAEGLCECSRCKQLDAAS